MMLENAFILSSVVIFVLTPRISNGDFVVSCLGLIETTELVFLEFRINISAVIMAQRRNRFRLLSSV